MEDFNILDKNFRKEITENPNAYAKHINIEQVKVYKNTKNTFYFAMPSADMSSKDLLSNMKNIQAAGCAGTAGSVSTASTASCPVSSALTFATGGSAGTAG